MRVLVVDSLWASVSNNSLVSIAHLLKHCTFEVKGKGQFKDEFVTAGGVPLSEIHLNTMESRIQPNLYFAGEVLNVDGLTGGFNFQILNHATLPSASSSPPSSDQFRLPSAQKHFLLH